MNAKELRTKTTAQLQKMLLEQKKGLEKLMGDVYKGKEKNICKSKYIRRDIARINTVLTEKKFIEENINA